MSSENSGFSFSKLLNIVILGFVLMAIMKVFAIIAYAILPKDKDGNVNPQLQAALTILVGGACLALLVAILEPPYHRVMDAPPGEVRTMMARKCIVQMWDYTSPNEVVKPTAGAWAYCTPLDAPDLPRDLQGLLLGRYDHPDPISELTKRNIKYRSSMVTMGSMFSDDPKTFKGPIWYWSDGTRVSSNKFGLF